MSTTRELSRCRQRVEAAIDAWLAAQAVASPPCPIPLDELDIDGLSHVSDVRMQARDLLMLMREEEKRIRSDTKLIARGIRGADDIWSRSVTPVLTDEGRQELGMD